MNQYDRNDVENKIRFSTEELWENDKSLFDYDVNERTISHRLAFYLQSQFKELKVDCEYNRHFENIKKLHLRISEVKTDDIHARTVFPDIIIHERHEAKNIVVIELKKDSASKEDIDFDKQKLEEYKKQIGYKHACLITIYTRKIKKPEIEFI